MVGRRQLHGAFAGAADARPGAGAGAGGAAEFATQAFGGRYEQYGQGAAAGGGGWEPARVDPEASLVEGSLMSVAGIVELTTDLQKKISEKEMAKPLLMENVFLPSPQVSARFKELCAAQIDLLEGFQKVLAVQRDKQLIVASRLGGYSLAASKTSAPPASAVAARIEEIGAKLSEAKEAAFRAEQILKEAKQKQVLHFAEVKSHVTAHEESKAAAKREHDSLAALKRRVENFGIELIKHPPKYIGPKYEDRLNLLVREARAMQDEHLAGTIEQAGSSIKDRAIVLRDSFVKTTDAWKAKAASAPAKVYGAFGAEIVVKDRDSLGSAQPSPDLQSQAAHLVAVKQEPPSQDAALEVELAEWDPERLRGADALDRLVGLSVKLSNSAGDGETFYVGALERQHPEHLVLTPESRSEDERERVRVFLSSTGEVFWPPVRDLSAIERRCRQEAKYTNWLTVEDDSTSVSVPSDSESTDHSMGGNDCNDSDAGIDSDDISVSEALKLARAHSSPKAKKESTPKPSEAAAPPSQVKSESTVEQTAMADAKGNGRLDVSSTGDGSAQRPAEIQDDDSPEHDEGKPQSDVPAQDDGKPQEKLGPQPDLDSWSRERIKFLVARRNAEFKAVLNERSALKRDAKKEISGALRACELGSRFRSKVAQMSAALERLVSDAFELHRVCTKNKPLRGVGEEATATEFKAAVAKLVCEIRAGGPIEIKGPGVGALGRFSFESTKALADSIERDLDKSMRLAARSAARSAPKRPAAGDPGAALKRPRKESSEPSSGKPS